MIMPDGSLGKGVEDVTVERSEDNDCSRLEASHDGYLRGFGLLHQRKLALANDGKEVRDLQCKPAMRVAAREEEAAAAP